MNGNLPWAYSISNLILLTLERRDLWYFCSNSHLYNVTKSAACWKFIPSQSCSPSKPVWWEGLAQLLFRNEAIILPRFILKIRKGLQKFYCFSLRLLQLIFCNENQCLEIKAILGIDSVCQPTGSFMCKYIFFICKNIC